MANYVLRSPTLTGPVGNDLQGQFELRLDRRNTAAKTFYAFIKSIAHKPVIVQEAEAMRPYEYLDPYSGDYYFGTSWQGTVAFGQWRTAVSYIFT